MQNVLVSWLCHFAKDTTDPNAQGVSNNLVKMGTWCVGFLALLLLCSLLEVANRRYLLHRAENFIKNKQMEPMVSFLSIDGPQLGCRWACAVFSPPIRN